MKRMLILGAGTAGTIMANKLVRDLPSDWIVTVVDQSDVHLYQPDLLFIPFGMSDPKDAMRPRQRFLEDAVNLIVAPIQTVDAENQVVTLVDGRNLNYDVLIVATGTRIDPSATEGMTGPGWHEKVFDFYTLQGATALRRKLESWDGGKLVINFVDMPIKCPVAPLEFAFLADHFFIERGIRDKVDITFATPLDGAFTKPRAAATLGGLLEQKGIAVESNFALGAVDGAAGKAEGYDGRTLDFDVMVTVPLHFGAEALMNSGLTDDFGFVKVNKNTLQSTAYDNVFAIGDASNAPTSKAGSVAHFMADVLAENVVRYAHGQNVEPDFDGHANCFIETGRGKALLIDFNYETEPLPGRFPLPGVGPFTLLEESNINHWGKRSFRWLYWNALLPGKPLPLDHRMVMAGKWS
jgi:sulfide:quinone oxidoreductase